MEQQQQSSEPLTCQSPYGLLVVLKRDGRDSASFELTDTEYSFGRASHCDIRIQVPTIGETHCRMRRNANGHMVLQNVDERGTGLNDKMLQGSDEATLKPGDVITVVERSFRYENPHYKPCESEKSEAKDELKACSNTPSKLQPLLDEFVPGSSQKTPRRLQQQQMVASSPHKFRVTPLKLSGEEHKATPVSTPLAHPSKLAQSPVTPAMASSSRSALGSAQRTPRTPRATIPGSPTVVDSEIVASPKFSKGEVYEYAPTSANEEIKLSAESPLAKGFMPNAEETACQVATETNITAQVVETPPEAPVSLEQIPLSNIEIEAEVSASEKPATTEDVVMEEATPIAEIAEEEASPTVDEIEEPQEPQPEETEVKMEKPITQTEETSMVEGPVAVVANPYVEAVQEASCPEGVLVDVAMEEPAVEAPTEVEEPAVEEPTPMEEVPITTPEVPLVEDVVMEDAPLEIEVLTEAVAMGFVEMEADTVAVCEKTAVVEEPVQQEIVENEVSPIEQGTVEMAPVEATESSAVAEVEHMAQAEELTADAEAESVETVVTHPAVGSTPITEARKIAVAVDPEPCADIAIEAVDEGTAETTEVAAEVEAAVEAPTTPTAVEAAVEAAAETPAEISSAAVAATVETPAEIETPAESNETDTITEAAPEVERPASTGPAEPTPEDLALISQLQQQDSTPQRRSTRQSSPYSQAKLAASRSSGVSTPLKASSTRDSLNGAREGVEEVRYVLAVETLAVTEETSTAKRSTRKATVKNTPKNTPASAASRRGSRLAKPAEPQSPSLRNSAPASDGADSENVVPSSAVNELTQSGRKRGRPAKTEEEAGHAVTPSAKTWRA